MIRPAFRNGFYAGALVAVIAGIYLFQLWQPDRQVHLHSVHLATALEQKEWDDVSGFLRPTTPINGDTTARRS
jgi:Na+/H+-dicarboxylate symporter